MSKDIQYLVNYLRLCSGLVCFLFIAIEIFGSMVFNSKVDYDYILFPTIFLFWSALVRIEL